MERNKVLVVEERRGGSASTRKRLVAQGLDVAVTHNAARWLSHPRGFAPDLIILQLATDRSQVLGHASALHRATGSPLGVVCEDAPLASRRERMTRRYPMIEFVVPVQTDEGELRKRVRLAMFPEAWASAESRDYGAGDWQATVPPASAGAPRKPAAP